MNGQTERTKIIVAAKEGDIICRTFVHFHNIYLVIHFVTQILDSHSIDEYFALGFIQDRIHHFT